MKFLTKSLNGAHAARAAVLAVSLLVSAPTLAQQANPASVKIAGEIVKITGALELFTPIVPGAIEQARLFFIQQNPLMTADATEIAAQLRKDYEGRITEVHNKVIEIYASHFTEAELKEVLAFYTSATGKKFLIEQPKIVDESLKFGQEWAAQLSDEVIGKMREGLKKKGYKL